MLKRRHVFAMAMCVVMLLSVIVSSAYIVHEMAHPHDCAGVDCPICQFIAQVEQVRRGFGMMLLALLLVCCALIARRERRAWVAAGVSALCTLVGRKVRLND